MAREYVTSESIVWLDYDPNASTLEIEFTSGGVYRYFGVPRATFQELRAAESMGRFVNDVIKKLHRFERVKPAQEG
ncbi:MAG: hypothetical protein QOD51_1380 [Candidatus Eremiobacteraeota bacterium]|jgi:hypothetical protein|nr:hypothetical protein [Candidatus Eremiobacteraeota bacterium]